jgi:hypothetical protein
MTDKALQAQLLAKAEAANAADPDLAERMKAITERAWREIREEDEAAARKRVVGMARKSRKGGKSRKSRKGGKSRKSRY